MLALFYYVELCSVYIATMNNNLSHKVLAFPRSSIPLKSGYPKQSYFLYLVHRPMSSNPSYTIKYVMAVVT